MMFCMQCTQEHVFCKKMDCRPAKNCFTPFLTQESSFIECIGQFSVIYALFEPHRAQFTNISDYAILTCSTVRAAISNAYALL